MRSDRGSCHRSFAGPHVAIGPPRRLALVEVFSLSGEHLRDMKTECSEPAHILLHGDRLFVCSATVGKDSLIYVLTLDGQLLQKYKMRDEDGKEVSYITSMVVLGKKMIVQCHFSHNLVANKDKLFALKGL